MQTDTGLKATPDASFLVHALLDLGSLKPCSPFLWTNRLPCSPLVVDSTLDIVDAYQRKIIDLEQQILLRAKMKAVRQRKLSLNFCVPEFLACLIICSATLRSLPVHIISGDLILYKRTLTPVRTLIYSLRRYDVDRTVALYETSELDGKKIEGYMSHKSKIYLADVHDHMEYIMTSMEMFAGIAENLINYSFNVSPMFLRP
jgi:Mg2+ and Co2+ transporter CorA